MTGFHSVEKIGGTSMVATAVLFENVLIGSRSGADLYNRIFVVSAYAGMTDLLLERKRDGAPGVYGRFVADDGADGWRKAMKDVDGAMKRRNQEMIVKTESLETANAFVDDRIAAVTGCLEDLARLRGHGRFCVKEQLVTVRELLASLGEAHSAHNTVLMLKDRGVNAALWT
jgi:aspartate kinase